jgi:hypothetical protein
MAKLAKLIEAQAFVSKDGEGEVQLRFYTDEVDANDMPIEEYVCIPMSRFISIVEEYRYRASISTL